jgi:hypothetical protein
MQAANKRDTAIKRTELLNIKAAIPRIKIPDFVEADGI